MRRRENLKPQTLVAILLLLLQIAWLTYTRLFQNRVLIDDAYIHFRNALNWATGHGLVYNAGERVLATTSPVFTLILGTLYRLTGIDLPRLANGFNFGCEVGIVLLLLAMLRRAGIPLFFRHAIVLITSFEVWRMIYSHSGMEMSLFIVAILGVLECVQRGWWPGAGVLLGILGWIRPEGAVVWVAVAVALAAVGRWGALVRIYGVAVGLAAAICGLLLVKYGTFMPQSIAAKHNAPWFVGSNGYGPVQFAITLGNLTFFQLFNGFRAAWGTLGDKVNSILGVIAQLAFMGFGAAWLWRRGERLLAIFLPLFVAGYYAFHAVLATCIFDWYFVPYYFVALLLSALGWWAIVAHFWGRINLRRPGRPEAGQVFYRLATPALVLLHFLSSAHDGMMGVHLTGHESFRQALAYRAIPAAGKDRELEYIEVAREFNALAPAQGPAPRVGCMEIGIFGYYYKGPVLDAFALVSPEALEILKPEVQKTLPPSCRDFPYNVFMHFKPPYIMSAGIFLRDEPKEFLDAYEVWHRPGGDDGIISCYRLKGYEKAAPSHFPARP